MEHFEKETLLKCRQEEAFAFHLDPQNLTKISPPWIKTQLLAPISEIHRGTIIDVRATRMYMPMIWKVWIEKLEAPSIIVDEAVHSPFAYWSHTHHFKDSKKGTIMIDSIDFKMPLGFVGALFAGFVKKDLDKMFTFRHQETKKLLESAAR